MSTFNSRSVTDAGSILIADIIATGAEFSPTRITIGSGYIPSGKSAKTMTDIVEKVVDLEVTKKRRLPTGADVLVGGSFSSASIAKDFYYRELGVYAKAIYEDGTAGGEVLYCYANAGDMAELVRAQPTGSATEIEVNNELYIGNEAAVSLEIVSGLQVTHDDLNAVKTELISLIDAIDITSQLTNYYTKTETDAKIAAAIEEEITSVLEGSF